MYRRRLVPFWLPIFLAAGLLSPLGRAEVLPAAPALAPAAREAMEGMSPARIREHVRYLADDRLEGRGSGTPGGLLAAQYLAARLQDAGLKPAGDGGTFLQQVPMARFRLDPGRSRITAGALGQVTLEFGRDFLINGMDRFAAVREAPLVFAGYGITAPEFRHDDYRDLDVKGKLVVLVSGEPPSNDPAYFAGGKDTPHAGGGSKILLARSKGAVGVITILTGERERGYPWPRVRGFQEAPFLALAPDPSDLPAVLLRDDGATRLLADAPQNWETVRTGLAQGALPTFELPGRARLELAMTSVPQPGPNVVGLVEGSDPELKKEAVVYSAHYDHLGRREGAGDVIYNGAWDNASGTAELLEIAAAFGRMKPRPRRSVLILLVTGEEHGLLGSGYYVAHPAVPMEQTAAEINLDMTDIFGLPKEIVPLGAEHSSLQEVCETAARQMDLKIGPDPTPEERTFTRSDQYSFVRAGVPSLFIRWATQYEDLTPEAAKARWKEKLRTGYHRAGDEFDPAWSWEGMRRHAQASFLIGVHVANQQEMPRWKKGDAFDAPRRTPRPAG